MEQRPTPSGFGGGPDPGPRCAPIRETAAEELEGLYRFAVARLGGKSQMAGDVVQQALTTALGHAAPPGAADAQRAWLRGIVRNVIRRELRSGFRGRAALKRAAAREPAHPVADPVEPRSFASAERERLIHALFLAVTALDTTDQDLFYAFYRSGRSHADLAEDLGISVKAVEARLYRLRARLRSMECFPGSQA